MSDKEIDELAALRSHAHLGRGRGRGGGRPKARGRVGGGKAESAKPAVVNVRVGNLYTTP